MQHVLDNPIYNALVTGSKHLDVGDSDATYFQRDVAPFAGLAGVTEDNFAALRDMVPDNGPYVFFSTDEIKFPEQWQVVKTFEMKQMVYDGPVPAHQSAQNITDLGEGHIPEMLALTELTAPGPFLQRTIEFGEYTGIFAEGKLVAMAGQRMQPLPYVEISAVCTHPDHLGKGYAGILLNEQIKRIMAAGKTPFLHVLADNPAIRVYQRVGFKNRTDILGYVCNI
ncbi:MULTISPECIES: GNAT family N-acetyltransferase [unclassified Mucilaginibacter]|uniref:GNAT family N-acetyltransferase n=1 Tax=unclassified Mucilaginibacter TaxID=2617802 RepID=UPI002AC9797A|nr:MULTISPECIES: GNAT family N-acetyltransferase [unclassified Mucilaginibacter]MEB0250069.1 GNAT family N-acetyltransferase [Mucilaginibacter sp. 5B2]MEB0260117.1 GNAT family N-acetyltransferase [Mucilaginibacter sp. 10I4]MEB0279162.1 GNAT family N-acetyltransferase [Mucilaginibacter sp. 10B2]MEB0301581.1 GNAT family N-acetyltransferase [Mucilaginibacter sp. 5C4]WPX22340.1 GNAT family N-acetyltransferase [Mucilaginibacter sp. 5C4]